MKFSTFLVMIISGFLMACSGISTRIAADDPYYSPPYGQIEAVPKPQVGALYTAGYGLGLFQDIKASRVGDILMVVFNESTNSSKAIISQARKQSDLTTPSPTVLGDATLSLGGMNLLNQGIESESEFRGEGISDQRNELSGNITVAVTKVFPNGLMEIRGEKWLELSHGKEFIRLKGLVRQQDIDPNNTIVSTKVADARITYSGTGEISDTAKMGWLYKFLTGKFWPL